jgi:hypothetical protein
VTAPESTSLVGGYGRHHGSGGHVTVPKPISLRDGSGSPQSGGKCTHISILCTI